MSKPATLQVPLHSAGLASVAGGLKTTLASLVQDAEAMPIELLQEYDCTGAAVAVLPAVQVQVHAPMLVRLRALLLAAAQDWAANTGGDYQLLAGERLFIVLPECCEPTWGGMLIAQAWIDLLGGRNPANIQVLEQRLSLHRSPMEALSAASRYVGASARSALVLAGETWLTHEGLSRLDRSDQLRCASADGVVPGEAMVLLRLERGAPGLSCSALDSAHAHVHSDRSLGSEISELLLALVFPPEQAMLLVLDSHPSHRQMSDEAENLRCRHWMLASGQEARQCLDSGKLGYLGPLALLLQLACLTQLPEHQLPAIAYARSLWRHRSVCARTPTRFDSVPFHVQKQ